MNDFDKRINLNVPLEELANEVCVRYSLGDFATSKLIQIGYEDYNFVLTTSNGKFMVKVFSLERTNEDCKNLVNRMEVAYLNGISCPKIYKSNGASLTIFTLNSQAYRLVVMQYIDGKDFFTLKQMPSINELEIIASEMAKLNSIEFKPPFIYDKWAIINYAKEYEKYFEYLSNEDKSRCKYAYEIFKQIDITKLKYGFVHGDIIETNVMKDKNGKLYFIDFSVSNYLPRIVDLAVTICDLCLDIENIESSKERIEIFLSAYEKQNKLNAYEKETLNKLFIIHQAITIINCSREISIENNDSEENKRYLMKGRIGFDILTKSNL